MIAEAQLIISIYGIFWCCWGAWVWLFIGENAPSLAWRVFLFTVSGPCVWAVGLVRAIDAAIYWARPRRED